MKRVSTLLSSIKKCVAGHWEALTGNHSHALAMLRSFQHIQELRLRSAEYQMGLRLTLLKAHLKVLKALQEQRRVRNQIILASPFAVSPEMLDKLGRVAREVQASAATRDPRIFNPDGQ